MADEHKLTPEQEARFPEWARLYSEKQLSCGVMDRNIVTAAVDDLYRVAGVQLPNNIAFVQSPMALVLSGCFAATLWYWFDENKDLIPAPLARRLVETATDIAIDVIRTALENDELSIAANSPLADIPRPNDVLARRGFKFTDWQQFRTDVLTATYAAAANAIAPVGARMLNRSKPFVTEDDMDDVPEQHFQAMVSLMLYSCRFHWRTRNGGSFWIFAISHLTFLRDVCNYPIPDEEALRPYEILAENSGPRMSHQNFCAVSEKPDRLKTIMDGPRYVAHATDGPSHLWRDGFALYHLNSINVPPWLVELAPEDMDARWVGAITDTSHRREFLRKIGIERVRHQLPSETVEASSDGRYELIRLQLVQDQPVPYLLMKNYSTGAYHLEGVPTECNTIQEALNARNGLTPDMIDNENGREWYQHGDVIIRPENEDGSPTKYKDRPLIIT